jgi:hypothetical protein
VTVGLTDRQAAKQQAKLKPVVRDELVPRSPVNEVEDATVGNEERLRGIPAVGRVSGTMKGTRPGDPVRFLDTEARELNEHARLITRGHLKRTRKRDHRDDRIEA